MSLRVVLVVSASILAVGCGSSGGLSAASCRSGFRHDGRLYLGITGDALRAPLPPAAGRIQVVMPACHDSTGSQDERATKQTVYRFRGVPASVLLADGPRHPSTIFLTRDSLVASASHPLHRYFYPGRRNPDHRRGGCRRRRAFTGHVPSAGVEGIADFLGVSGHALWLDATTRIVAPTVAGVPRLHAGERVRVTAERCGRSSRDTALAIVTL